VDEKKGSFYFDPSHRPCGLQQQFIGITEKKPIKRYQVTDEVCYEKVLDHSKRKFTFKTLTHQTGFSFSILPPQWILFIFILCTCPRYMLKDSVDAGVD
jgi:hypothetical protein